MPPPATSEVGKWILCLMKSTGLCQGQKSRLLRGEEGTYSETANIVYPKEVRVILKRIVDVLSEPSCTPPPEDDKSQNYNKQSAEK